MKLTSTLLLIILCSLGYELKAQAASSKEATVQAWVEVNKNTPSIKIRWPYISGITKYNIYRKTKDETFWGSAVKGTVNGTDTFWIDTDVKVGNVYEYNIIKVVGTQNIGVTYILSGIEVPVVHSRGNALVVVEKSLATSISAELDGYFKDIAADGWKVYSIQVLKTDSVQKVKREILKINNQSGGIKSLIILGHVPVPYSGDFGQGNYSSAPDGHLPDHNGAWPTDAYYSIDYDSWNDGGTNTGASRAENKNFPNDNKFDETQLPGLVNYYTGRIDLSNMPKFLKTEADLTKQYIKKAHDFRYKITQTVEKGVIDENFNGPSYGYFASSAWRNFSVMFGPKNVVEADLLTSCKSENLLFSYGCGAGSYQSCSGIGTTDDFVTNKGAIFNMLFGSYFGDWDNANNILRAPLASTENGLTNAWSGRPYSQNHQMALGEPIGYCAMVTQNNTGTYAYNVFANIISIELMGDPTLRLHMLAPPTNVITAAQSNNTKVNITWTASTEPGILGYYIYRSGNPLSNNFPINSTPITGTSFVDNAPFQGTNYYLVKAVKLTTSASGSYFNLSHGNGATITGITGALASLDNIIKQTIGVYPNPAKDVIILKFSSDINSNTINFFNSQGILVKSIETTLHNNFISAPIIISDLASGFYYIKAGAICGRFIKE